MRRYLVPLIIAGVLLAPAIASAVSWFPIVPCGVGGAPACTSCDLFKTFKNVIDLVLYGITGPIAAFMIVWAGGMMLLGGANPKLYSQGTTMLKNTLIGVAIILGAWLFTNTLIKTLGTGSASDSWFTFSCPKFLTPTTAQASLPAPVTPRGNPASPAPELAAASKAVCAPASLAAANHVPNNTKLNSPSLTALISCINRDPIVAALYNPKFLFTYEQSNPLCNLTHGVSVCGICAHGQYSCHYGGQNGSQGAMAVDYNWNGKPVQYVIASRLIVPANGEPCKTTPEKCRTVTGGEGLFDELYRSLVKNRCAYKLINFEPQAGGHTHISTPDCDKDGKGTNGRVPPILP